jgi:hypothetical protein
MQAFFKKNIIFCNIFEIMPPKLYITRYSAGLFLAAALLSKPTHFDGLV